MLELPANKKLFDGRLDQRARMCKEINDFWVPYYINRPQSRGLAIIEHTLSSKKVSLELIKRWYINVLEYKKQGKTIFDVKSEG